MNLELVLKETGQSWTLEPTRDYIVGTDRTCDIDLSEYPDVASRHLRLSCDRVSNVWYVEDLGTTVGTYIDGEAISRSLIEQSVSIRLANKILITAEPISASVAVSAATTVSSAQATVGRSSSYNTEDVRNSGFRDVVRDGGRLQPNDVSSLDSIVDRAAEYAKIGLAGTNRLVKSALAAADDMGLASANRLVKSALAAADDMNERSIARDRRNHYNKGNLSNEIKIGYAGLSSPTDGAGINIPTFSMSTTMKVDRSKVAEICEKLYKDVHLKIGGGTLGNAQSRLVTYVLDDWREEKKESRQYILATHNTKNEVRTTIFIRFLASGDNLFVGIDVYILGQLDRQLYQSRRSSTLLLIVLSPFTLFLTLIPAYSMWDKLRKRVQYEGDLELARRQEFPGEAKFDAFDEDDVLIFIKTSLHAALDSIAEVFMESGLPLESLDTFMKQVDSGSTTVVNNYGNMDMRGAAVGAGSKAGYAKSVSK